MAFFDEDVCFHVFEGPWDLDVSMRTDPTSVASFHWILVWKTKKFRWFHHDYIRMKTSILSMLLSWIATFHPKNAIQPGVWYGAK